MGGNTLDSKNLELLMQLGLVSPLTIASLRMAGSPFQAISEKDQAFYETQIKTLLDIKPDQIAGVVFAIAYRAPADEPCPDCNKLHPREDGKDGLQMAVLAQGAGSMLEAMCVIALDRHRNGVSDGVGLRATTATEGGTH